MTLTFKLVAFLVLVLAFSVDYYITNKVQNLIVATCDTKVTYDKSGDMYCMDTPKKSVRVSVN